MPDSHSESAAITVDYRSVAKVSRRAALRDVRLSWCQVGLFGDRASVESDWPEDAVVGFDSHASALDGGTELHVHCSFFCWYKRGLELKADADPPEFDRDNPPDLAIEAVFELCYALSEVADLEQSDLDDFAIANGTHNAWPYWREFVQSMTLRLTVPPYIVGPFKLPSSHDEQGQSAVDDEDA